jgi:hypothetical protein
MIADYFSPLRHVGGLCFRMRIFQKAGHPGLWVGGRGCLVPVLGMALGIALALWAAGSTAPALADGPVRVGLYVQFEDGSSVTRCVALNPADYPPGKEATGLDVLRQSGLGLVFETGGGFGVKICKLDKTGCDFPAEDCFCRCQGNPCQYWTYWYAENGAWKYSSVGANGRQVKDGDVEGWVWGSGKTAPPTSVLAAGICSPQATATSALSAPAEPGQVPTPTEPRQAPAAPAPTNSAQPPLGTPNQAGPTAPPQPAATLVPTGPASAAASSTLPTFIWLVVGLSGLAVVLLGLAYLAMRGRS